MLAAAAGSALTTDKMKMAIIDRQGLRFRPAFCAENRMALSCFIVLVVTADSSRTSHDCHVPGV